MFAYLLHTVGNCVPLTLVVAAVNWLGGETKKRTRLEKVGEERVYRGLKPLGDVLDHGSQGPDRSEESRCYGTIDEGR